MSNLMKKLTIGNASYEVCDASARETLESKASYVDMNAAVRKAAPRNLLDNSDFRNPVNQRGYDGSYISAYAIDRWFFHQVTAPLSADGITISGNLIYQYLDNIGTGKKVTGVACLSDGTKYVESATIPPTETDTITVFNVTYANERQLAVNLSGTNLLQFIFSPGENPATVAWVALYEGEYTAETLPEYQPKGYGAELAECQRYYREDMVLPVYQVSGPVYLLSHVCQMRDMRAYIPSFTLKKFTKPDVIDITSFTSTDSIGVEYMGNGKYLLSRAYLSSCSAYDIGMLRFNVSADL